MPARRPHTAAVKAQRPPRPSRDASQSRGGGTRGASQSRGAHPTQNRSASLRESSLGGGGRPPRSAQARHPHGASTSTPPLSAHAVQEDTQQREQQIEQMLAALSSEDRRVFGLMSGVLVRQPVVQAHRLLACLAYQSETRRYLAQYGGVRGTSSDDQHPHTDEDEDMDDKARSALLQELEDYHTKATAQEAAAAQRDERRARRARWVQANAASKKAPTQTHTSPRANGAKKDRTRTPSKGRASQPTKHTTTTNNNGTATSPTNARQPRAVMTLAGARTPSPASSTDSSRASTRSPSARAKITAAAAGPRGSAPLSRSPPRPVAAPPADTGTPTSARAATTTMPHDPASADDHTPEFTLHTSLPAPPVLVGAPSAPEPSASAHSLPHVPEPPLHVPAVDGYNDAVQQDNNLTNWLFTDQSAPATNAHPAPAVGDDMDDLFGIHAGAAPAPAQPNVTTEVEDLDDLFVPGAPLAAAAHATAMPIDEPLDAVPEMEEMKMPWDDI